MFAQPAVLEFCASSYITTSSPVPVASSSMIFVSTAEAVSSTAIASSSVCVMVTVKVSPLSSKLSSNVSTVNTADVRPAKITISLVTSSTSSSSVVRCPMATVTVVSELLGLSKISLYACALPSLTLEVSCVIDTFDGSSPLPPSSGVNSTSKLKSYPSPDPQSHKAIWIV